MNKEDKFRMIKEHWEASADSETDYRGLKPTAPDPFLQELIENSMLEWLDSKSNLLDIGCGDGSSTCKFATKAGKTVGVDYVEDFIRTATFRSKNIQQRKPLFEVGSILDIGKDIKKYKDVNVVSTIRCLINLPSLNDQEIALQAISDILPKGGLYLCAEGWVDGIEGLNRYRKKFTLDEIKVASFNLFFRREKFENIAKASGFKIEKYVTIGYYLFMSRVFQALYKHPLPPVHDDKINEISAQIFTQISDESIFKDCDYAGVYILRKI